MISKKDIRKVMLAKRRGVSDELAQASEVIVSKCLKDFLKRNTIKCLALYSPIHKEIDLLKHVPHLKEYVDCICLPRVVELDAPLAFYKWEEGDALTEDMHGVPSPVAEVEKECIPDVVVAPVVAFNKKGIRLGYGSGYYDKTFDIHPEMTRIGVGYSFQLSPLLNGQEYDIPMQYIYTEEGVFDIDV